ncbi:MAG: retropepsin-like aspartic protease [Bacteroidales bacterium]|nr:retropepsin-like aspartic protease [Bacteroidales bacterium]HOL98995.1 retropepsin-like aspartic protease [Bacteroidales bacterium]HOM37299.1 retropepsin-like aspartic protease [Bacteroidales bacterium]HPD24805.1 retropepsin-like aspartic protease [Bacteroidales bacterium]HRT00583.1 retropepsin-like aspartic protease [Bacteroidales bacterium]
MKKQKEYRIKLNVLNIRNGGHHFYVNSRINGQKVRLLIDTGASSTVMDRNNPLFENFNFEDADFIDSGSGFNSNISDISVAELDTMIIGRYKIKNFLCLFTPMDHVNELYTFMGFKKIAGILGSDFLLLHKAIIDLKKFELILTEIKIT